MGSLEATGLGDAAGRMTAGEGVATALLTSVLLEAQQGMLIKQEYGRWKARSRFWRDSKEVFVGLELQGVGGGGGGLAKGLGRGTTARVL